MSWQEIWKGTASDGRTVTAKRNSEDDIRLTTTTAEDEEGIVEADQNSTLIVPPSAAGRTIDIDPDPDQSLEDALIKDGGFSESDAQTIAKQVRAAAEK